MAAKRTSSRAVKSRRGIVPHRYVVHKKNAVWLEFVALFGIWLLFILGLAMVFVFRDRIPNMQSATNVVLMGILFLALVPFLANWGYYSAIWKGWSEGSEIVYKRAPRHTHGHSVLGNREVWIRVHDESEDDEF